MAEEGRPERRPELITILLGVGCVLLSVLVVLLALQNLNLKQRLTETQSPIAADALKTGDRLGGLVLVEATGDADPRPFDPETERTLLLFFSATCPACLETLPQWRTLLSGGSSAAVRVVGVQLDAQAEPVLVPFPAYRADRENSPSLHRIPYVPATVLLDTEGIVEHVWFGVLGEEQQRILAAWLVGTP